MWDLALNVKSWIYKNQNFLDLHQDIAQTPQGHISIDLLGPYKITSQGNSHALTVECNLTSYLMTMSLKNKKTMTIANHLVLDIIWKLSFPRILHSNSGTEFKYKLVENLSQKLGIRKTFLSPHHPQANGKLESSHRFIKNCIWKFL